MPLGHDRLASMLRPRVHLLRPVPPDCCYPVRWGRWEEGQHPLYSFCHSVTGGHVTFTRSVLNITKPHPL